MRSCRTKSIPRAVTNGFGLVFGGRAREGRMQSEAACAARVHGGLAVPKSLAAEPHGSFNQALTTGQEADDALEAEVNKLVGAGAPALARLSETELLARVIQGEPTLAVREKTLILTTLLNEAGEVAAAQDRPEEARECRLKALHLLLDVLGRGEIFECPEFVPAVDVVVTSLQDAPLPPRTRALVMQHYERAGEFAKAEDAFFALLEADRASREIVDFGIAFYERLLTQSDAALAAANLPRSEVEEGLKDLQRRLKTLA